jgi:hypothetical protein
MLRSHPQGPWFKIKAFPREAINGKFLIKKRENGHEYFPTVEKHNLF